MLRRVILGATVKGSCPATLLISQRLSCATVADIRIVVPLLFGDSRTIMLSMVSSQETSEGYECGTVSFQVSTGQPVVCLNVPRGVGQSKLCSK